MPEFPTFSPLIIGTMRLGQWGAKFDTSQLQSFVEECLGLGLTTFDHADIYGDYTTEADFGKMLKQQPGLRSHVQIITKFGIRRVCEQRPAHQVKSYDSSPEHMIASVENSLRELHTDHVDALLIHRPDFLMHPDEIAETANKLIHDGKIRALGVSNFSPSQFELLHSRIPLCTNQVEVSPVKLDTFEDGTLDQCLRLGVRPMAWSPFGGGAIFTEGGDRQTFRIKEVVIRLQEKYDASGDQVLLAWLMAHPSGIQPVIGTTKIRRVESAKGALDIQMDREDWYDLWQESTGEMLP